MAVGDRELSSDGPRRYLHFVGTMPQFADSDAAFTWQLKNLRGQLRWLTSGETGPRLQWFVPVVKRMKELSQIRTVRDGDWSGYDDTDRLALPSGFRLSPREIPLHLAEHAQHDLDALNAAISRHEENTDLLIQVGVPGFVDMALFIFGPPGVIRLSRSFLLALADQIAVIHRRAAGRVVFQLEVPAALIAVAATPPLLRSLVAEIMAHLVTRQVARAPEGSRFGVHLCLGDLGHRALRQLRTADPLVHMANALVRRWPSGRVLEFLHLPMSGGDQPPTTDPSFYLPLRRLNLDPRIPLAAGIAHESQGLPTQLTVRSLVETAVGRRVDIATSCGLGRRTPGQAEAAVSRMRALS